MTRNVFERIVSQRAGAVLGSLSFLLVLGATGLELLTQQSLGQANMMTILFALYLATWSYALGVVGSILLVIWGLARWLSAWAVGAAANREMAARPALSRHETGSHAYPGQALRRESGSSGHSDGRNEASRSMRVA